MQCSNLANWPIVDLFYLNAAWMEDKRFVFFQIPIKSVIHKLEKVIEIGQYDSGNDGSSLPLRNGNSMQFFKCIMKIPCTKLKFDRFNK